MELLVETRKELLRLKSELLGLKVELKFARFVRAAFKAGFNHDQPRDERGRWTNGAAGITDFSAQRRTRTAIDYSDALTGVSSIDDTTKSLSDMLGRTMEVMDFIPEWTPQLYGTAVHVAFGTAVRLEGIRGIGFNDVEHSFRDGGEVQHGELGSIRTDVLLRNEVGDIIALRCKNRASRPLAPTYQGNSLSFRRPVERSDH